MTAPANPANESLPSVSSNMSSGMTYQETISTTSEKIKNSDEFQGCMKQNTNMCIQSAGMQLAQKAKDPAFCKELSSPDQRSSCEFAVTMINATEKNDIKLCDSLSDANYQKQCKIQLYRQEATSKGDITLCDKIADIEKASTGTGMMDMQMGMGMNMQKDQCIMQVVMSGTGTSDKDCEAISNTGSLDMCKMMMKNKTNMPTPTALPVGPTPSR
jgi:hypothetical protein